MNALMAFPTSFGMVISGDAIVALSAVRRDAAGTTGFFRFVETGTPAPPAILKAEGIPASAMKTALPIETVREDLLAFLPPECVLLVHDSAPVRNVLHHLLSGASKHTLLDTRELAGILFPSTGNHDLRSLADVLGLQPDPDVPDPGFRFAQDSLLILSLWDRLAGEAASLPKSLVRELYALFAPLRSHPLRTFFKTCSDAPRRADAYPEAAGGLRGLFSAEVVPRIEKQNPDGREWVPVDVANVEKLLGAGGILASNIPDYEFRQEQVDMAIRVTEALNASKHLVVEAGTGTGKSLAYLVPAILWAVANDMPVVVSTNTKNLQSQLLGKDLPLLTGLVGRGLKAAVIKGRRNYLCVRKLLFALEHAGLDLSPEERLALAGVLVWSIRSASGDLSECSAAAGPADPALHEMITADASECRGGRCDHRSRCFLFRARRHALSAHIVIANHAVVFTEMADGDSSMVLPPYRHAILDEAHNLEDAATRGLSMELSRYGIHFLLGRLWRPGRRHHDGGILPALTDHLGRYRSISPEVVGRMEQDAVKVMDAMAALDPVIDTLFSELSALLEGARGRESLRYSAERRIESDWALVLGARENLGRALGGLSLLLSAIIETLGHESLEAMPDRENFAKEINGVLVRVKQFSAEAAFVVAGASPDHVFWVERTKGRQGGARAWAAPISVGAMLAEQLYAQKASIIFTSATLTVNGSLDFVKKRLGLNVLEPGRILEMTVGSPFDYARQCTFMVPLFLPEPGESGGNYAEALGLLLAEVFRRTHGRALTLFTSYDMLQGCARTLRAQMGADSGQLLVHGESGSREHITQTFKQQTESVLFGTHSFWEGVDVPGESLTCLVLARLPFPVFTDPIVEARCERLESEGTSAFAGYSIPAAVIRFRQGFGRLIRHRNDRGIVIVADRRVAQKSYGQWFRRSVPAPMQSYAERGAFLDAVDQFVRQMSGERDAEGRT